MSGSFSAMSPTDIDFFYFDFTSNLAAHIPPDSLTGTPSVTATPSGLTIGAPIISGGMVGVQISGSGSISAGISFQLVCEVNTTAGRTLTRTALLPITPDAIQ